MKTTKPKPGAVGKRRSLGTSRLWRVLKDFKNRSRKDAILVFRTWESPAVFIGPRWGDDDEWSFSPATARRIAKALLAAAGGTP